MKNKEVNLNQLSKEELISIIQSQHANRENINHIAITDFEVSSNTETLRACERTINRLIHKHKEFAQFRKRKAQLDDSMFNNTAMGVG